MGVGEADVVADGGRYDARSLTACFPGDESGGDAVVVVVEVADGFVEHYEVERLADAADYRHPLLLTDRHASGRIVAARVDAQLLEPAEYHLVGGVAGETVLELDVVPRRQLRKERQLLRQVCEVTAAYLLPSGYAEGAHILAVEEDASLVVGAGTEYVSAHRGLATAAGGLDKIEVAPLEGGGC